MGLYECLYMYFYDDMTINKQICVYIYIYTHYCSIS